MVQARGHVRPLGPVHAARPSSLAGSAAPPPLLFFPSPLFLEPARRVTSWAAGCPAPSEPPTKLTRAGQRGQKATLQRRPLNRRGRPAQRPWKDLSAPSTVRAVSDGESKRPAPFCKAQQLATARSSPSLVRVGFHNGGPRAQGPPEPCGRLWRPSGGCLHLRPASTRGDYGQRKLALLGAP